MSVSKARASRSLLRGVGVPLAVIAMTTGYAMAAQPGRAAASDPRPSALQQAADRLVADGVPGAIIAGRDGRHISFAAAGLADKATSQAMRPRDRVHIGSITKTFVATAVLQLAAQHRLSLNDSVQRWLPGVITGHGYNPARITVHQLLQQNSGLRDYTSSPGFLTLQSLGKVWQPRQLVDLALRLGPPVRGWLYSNTNYVLLGMIIERVTGDSVVGVINRQILRPLGLGDTSFPVASTKIPGPHSQGYYGSVDVTRLVNPSTAWASGAMISSVGDVARFYRALLTGQLLPRAEQREMLTAIAVNDPGSLFAEHYGLGIYRVQLPCGTAWGHDGGYPGGFKTFALSSPDGSRESVLVFNDFKMSMAPPAGTGTPAFNRDVKKALETAFCG